MRRLAFFFLMIATACSAAPTSPPPPNIAASPDALPLTTTLVEAFHLSATPTVVPAPRLLDETARSPKGWGASFIYYVPPGLSVWSASLALDALALIVNPANPTDSLSLQQVRDIFTGRVHNWPGGGEIEIVTREDGADIRQFFDANALGGVRPSLTALVAPGPQEMMEEVERNPQAIGYASFANLTPGVKAILVEGVAPSVLSNESGDYPLVMPLFAVAAAEPTGPTRDFLIWIQSEERQGALGERYGRVRP